MAFQIAITIVLCNQDGKKYIELAAITFISDNTDLYSHMVKCTLSWVSVFFGRNEDRGLHFFEDTFRRDKGQMLSSWLLCSTAIVKA